MFEIVKNKNNLNLLIISDLHLCNKLDRMVLVHKAYEYANRKRIRYILNLGDLIDGVMPHNYNDIKIKTVEEQVQYVIEHYPSIPGIKTLILYGNHDYYSKYNGGIDVAEEISKERKDIFNLGYQESFIRISDNFIKLGHEVSYIKGFKKPVGTALTFMGHYHMFKVKVNDDNIYINVPSLSSLNPSTNLTNIPCMLDVNIAFYNDIFSKISIDVVDLDNDIISSSFEGTINVNNKRHSKIKEEMKEYNLI